jgi:hypothetical protein
MWKVYTWLGLSVIPSRFLATSHHLRRLAGHSGWPADSNSVKFFIWCAEYRYLVWPVPFSGDSIHL